MKSRLFGKAPVRPRKAAREASKVCGTSPRKTGESFVAQNARGDGQGRIGADRRVKKPHPSSGSKPPADRAVTVLGRESRSSHSKRAQDFDENSGQSGKRRSRRSGGCGGAKGKSPGEGIPRGPLGHSPIPGAVATGERNPPGQVGGDVRDLPVSAGPEDSELRPAGQAASPERRERQGRKRQRREEQEGERTRGSEGGQESVEPERLSAAEEGPADTFVTTKLTEWQDVIREFMAGEHSSRIGFEAACRVTGIANRVGQVLP